MKIRFDFVTNSSSTSYIFVAFYSKEMLDFLRELIDSGFVFKKTMDSDTMKGYLTNEYGVEHPAITSIECFPYYGEHEKIGFQISLCSYASKLYTTDPYDALMRNFVDFEKMTDEEKKYYCDKAKNLIERADKNGEILACHSKGMTDDFNGHYSEKDHDYALYDATNNGVIKICKNEDITEAEFYNPVTKIENSVFENHKSLKKVIFYANKYSGCKIEANAFKNCTDLEEFPFEQVVIIKTSAFEGCESLREIDLSNVQEIGSNAFFGCVNLEKVTLASRDSVVKKGAFDNCPKLTIYAKDDGSIIPWEQKERKETLKSKKEESVGSEKLSVAKADMNKYEKNKRNFDNSKNFLARYDKNIEKVDYIDFNGVNIVFSGWHPVNELVKKMKVKVQKTVSETTDYLVVDLPSSTYQEIEKVIAINNSNNKKIKVITTKNLLLLLEKGKYE